MKWGVRRYQNPDGTKTAAGRRRYRNADGTLTKSGRRKITKGIKRRQQHTYSNSDRERDTSIYGKRGARRIEKRMNEKGMTKRRARAKELVRQTAEGYAIAAVAMDVITKGALHRYAAYAGKRVLNKGARAISDFLKQEAIRRATPKIAQNHKYDPIDVAFKIFDVVEPSQSSFKAIGMNP